MGEWKEYRIGDKHIDLISGYAFKSKNFLESQEDGSLPVIKIKNVANGDVNLNKVVYHAYDVSLSKFKLSKDDVLIAMTGNHPTAKSQVVGNVSKYKLSEESLLNQRVGKIIIKGKNDLDFFYYFLKDRDTHKFLANQSSGSANQANISKADILNIETEIPEPKEQKAISSVLSRLDDKIDLLHRQNATLEGLAEVMFREWFVEKDNTKSIADLIDLQNGYAFKGKDLVEVGHHRVIKIRNISAGIVNIYNSDFVPPGVAKNTDDKFKIKSGDILFAMTGAEIGKMGLIPENNLSLLLNQRVGLFKEKYKSSKFLAYLQLKSDFGQDYIDSTATGSAQPNISATGIEDCEFPEISEEEIISYSKILEPFFKKIIFNLGQIKKIENLRDTLLPKLMSGEVRVKY